MRADVTSTTLNFLRWALALLGFTGIAAFQTLGYVARTMTTAMNSAPLLSWAPLATAALACGFEVALGNGLPGSATAWAAIAFVAGLLGAQLAPHQVFGTMLILCSVVLANRASGAAANSDART